MSGHTPPGRIERTETFRHVASAASGAFPPDLLRHASRRLAICSLAIAVFLAINFLIFSAMPMLGGPALTAHLSSIDVLLLVAIVLSLGVWLLARSERLAPERKLDLGLAYEIALAFWLGVLFKTFRPEYRFPERGVSEMCILILVFPFLAPSSPRRTLVASLIAASMDPLGYLVNLGMGRDVPTASGAFVAYYWNYLCAGLAVIPASLLRRLSRELIQARRLGSYHLVERLGEGGMGEVWRARHEHLARDAAIKIIRPERLHGSRDEAAKSIVRFEREARVTATLQSPHSVELYDFGIAEDGTFFYVMELLDGLDLQKLVAEHGPQPSERVAHILAQACHSLADAHDRGLIHRDIKPANLLVCRKGRDVDFVKVLDFGLVKGGDPAPRDAWRTRDGAVVGTPAFMAPEMFQRDQPIDGRADLYSLGCVGYWLLTGRLVFTAESPGKMLLQHAQATPEPPSTAAPGPVDAALERVVLRCLKKRVEERPASAAELKAELDETGLGERWAKNGSREWWAGRAPASPNK